MHRQVVTEQKLLIVSDVWADAARVKAMHEQVEPLAQVDMHVLRSWLGVPLQAQGRVIGMLAVSHAEPDRYDEHDGKLAAAFANQAAIAIENAQLYEQAKELAAVQERQHLARELHDAVSQMLFSASLIAEALPELWKQDRAEGRRRLKELGRLTHGALAEMRMVLLELRPAALLEVSLHDLMGQLARATMGHTNLAVSVDSVGYCPVPPDPQVVLYRIAQEALNNIVKHAQASQVRIRLRCSSGENGGPDRVELRINDNGCGFNPQEFSCEHMGLRIMRERAESVGGELAVTSRPGRGTRVRVLWPRAEKGVQ